MNSRPSLEPDIALSLVIPVFNERESLLLLDDEIEASLKTLDISFEVIFVDDASTDGSLELLLELSTRRPNRRVLKHLRNAGQSAALVAGFRAARGDLVATLDADLQNDPADLPRLLKKLWEGYDVVSGVRSMRRDSLLRRISSKIANAIRNWTTKDHITDVGCSLKIYRAEYLKDLPCFVGMHRFLPTLARWNGAQRIAEVEVQHRPRRFGKAKYGISNRALRTFVDLLGVLWLRKRFIARANVRDVTPGLVGR